MDGLRFRAYLLDAAVFGFIGGWIAGMFLGLWAYATLFAHDFSREILMLICCVLLVCVLLLLYRKRKRKAHRCTAMGNAGEARQMSNKWAYFLFGGVLGWLISGQFLK